MVLCFQDDVSLNGYQKYLITQSSPAPLTTAEEELRQIKISEVLHLGLETKLFVRGFKAEPGYQIS